jgi:hypothetical protein
MRWPRCLSRWRDGDPTQHGATGLPRRRSVSVKQNSLSQSAYFRARLVQRNLCASSGSRRAGQERFLRKKYKDRSPAVTPAARPKPGTAAALSASVNAQPAQGGVAGLRSQRTRRYAPTGRGSSQSPVNRPRHADGTEPASQADRGRAGAWRNSGGGEQEHSVLDEAIQRQGQVQRVVVHGIAGKHCCRRAAGFRGPNTWCARRCRSRSAGRPGAGGPWSRRGRAGRRSALWRDRRGRAPVGFPRRHSVSPPTRRLKARETAMRLPTADAYCLGSPSPHRARRTVLILVVRPRMHAVGEENANAWSGSLMTSLKPRVSEGARRGAGR